jgi:uncharacterized Zn-binding protein involved in type VI secretion
MSNDARIGDVTDHGGVIVTGAGKTIVEGVPTARIGDLHVCPIPGHGTNPIVTGAGKMVVEGAPTARIGDMTACGATIVSGAARLIIGT